MEEKFTKVKNIIKEKDNLILIVVIILSLIGINLNVNVIDSDELWLFQNAYKMYNGYELYTDINSIITPLFIMIANMFFKVLGANFLSYRILSIVIQTGLFLISYLILKRLGVEKKKSFLVVQILLLLGFSTLIIGANYNILGLVFCLVGLYLNLKPKKYNAIAQGFILFIIFLTKQNMAVFYGASLILYELTKKNDKKLKNIIQEIGCFALLTIISIAIMNFADVLDGFINYAILGLKEFAIENIYINWGVFPIALAIIFVNIITTVLIIKTKICANEEKENLIAFNIFSFSMIGMAYPIFNEYHIILAIYPMILLIVYEINILLKNLELNIKSGYSFAIIALLSIILIGRSGYSFENWRNSVNSYISKNQLEKDHPFYGGVFKEGVLESIENVCEYIEENSRDVVVLSSRAAYYNICLKTSNGMFDLPFLGNLGEEGEDGLIKQIKNLEKTEILIEKNEEELISQESLKARAYIKENFEKIGEIEEFEIYFSN